MTNPPLVSIIIPNYNHAKFLPERLNSIFNQTYKNFEAIILDDASTDNSLDILTPYKTHPKVSHFIVNNKNTSSPFKQWYKGLHLAQGDYIWIAESDDCCEFNFLESQLAFIQKTGVVLAVAETKKTDSYKVIGFTRHPVFKNRVQENLNLDYFLYCPILNVSAVVFKNLRNYSDFTFHNYDIIGDRVFYHQAFYNKSVGLNSGTFSYFRKVGNGLSTLDVKGMDYLINYYKEHQRFAHCVLLSGTIDLDLYKTYITRFYNRVNNRLNRKQKLSMSYLILRLLHHKCLKVTLYYTVL